MRSRKKRRELFWMGWVGEEGRKEVRERGEVGRAREVEREEEGQGQGVLN
jgi:hypothetical protein